MSMFGGVFEHSPWVAERAWAGRPFGSVDALHAAMVDAVGRAPREVRMELIAWLTAAYRAHFGFPFVVCAREHTPDSIIATAERRMESDPAEEEQTALARTARIARLRLADLVAT